MPGMYADNAIAAKIKALYGKRLTADNYAQLLQKKSVSEVAAYLKQETYYSTVLGEIKEALVHRGQLENMVRKHPVDIYERLMRYNFGTKFFPMIYTSENEISQLLIAMRMLNSNAMDRFIVTFPAYLDKYLSFDLFSLARIKNFDDLLETVRHSDYYKLLGPHRPVGAQPINVLGCETALLTHHFTMALDLAQRAFPENVHKDLMAILRIQIDLQNLTVIYRMKKFYGSSPDEIKSRLIPIKTRISDRIYNDLVETESADTVLDHLQDVRILRHHFDMGNTINGLEHAIDNLRQNTCQHIFRFSMRPVVILMSYMTLLDIEGDNLVNIIEGIRYDMPPDDIRKLLVIAPLSG